MAPRTLTEEIGDRAVGAVLGANPFVRLDPTDMLASTAQVVAGLLLRPQLATDRLRHLSREGYRVLVGTSEVAPDRRDTRFTDPTWRDNSLYRRLMQFYLMTEDQLTNLPDDIGLEGAAASKARFVFNTLAEAMAPTNLLVGNPAALKRAFETGGRSLVAGARNFWSDLRHNGGMPVQVDTRLFRVGENLAVTPGAVVHRSEVLELIQYRPLTSEVHRRPLLVIPPQINKYYVLDLAAGRSMVEHAVSRGQQTFMVSWRNPSREHRDWDLARYVREIEEAIDVARRISRCETVNLLGACAGGLTAATLLAHLAGLGDDRVNSVTFLVTVLDTEAPTAATLFVSDRGVAMAIRRSRRRGYLEGRELARAFAWLRPNDLVWNYWINNYLMGNQPPAFDVLAWNADSTNLPAGLHIDFLRLFGANALTKPGTMDIDGIGIDLSQVKIDAYVVGALTDHITPWQACYRTGFLLGGETQFVLSSSGHIQALVNPPDNPKARYFTNPELPIEPEDWLAGATERHGSWWDHWLDWLAQRAEELRPAPRRLGSKAQPPLEPAPGQYVRG